jgi:hypothetical protein
MLWDGEDQMLEEIEFEADLPADSGQMVHRLNWTLPAAARWLLTCQVAHEGETLACNRYDLSIHDGIRPNWRQRLRSWLVGLVSPA